MAPGTAGPRRRGRYVHVGLGCGEHHLGPTLTGVPAEDGLAAEHAGELLPTRMDISWMAVELLRKVADVLRPLGRPQAEDLM